MRPGWRLLPIRPGGAVRSRRAGPGISRHGSSPRLTPCRRAIACCRVRRSPAWWRLCRVLRARRCRDQQQHPAALGSGDDRAWRRVQKERRHPGICRAHVVRPTEPSRGPDEAVGVSHPSLHQLGLTPDAACAGAPCACIRCDSPTLSFRAACTISRAAPAGGLALALASNSADPLAIRNGTSPVGSGRASGNLVPRPG